MVLWLLKGDQLNIKVEYILKQKHWHVFGNHIGVPEGKLIYISRWKIERKCYMAWSFLLVDWLCYVWGWISS